jgi:hypothetical protein
MVKQGVYKGYNAGCCNGLEVWGLSCKAPNFPQDDSDYERPWVSYDIDHPLRDIDLTGYYSHEIRPELWERGPGTASWELFAAMVPGTYPHKGGENANDPTSSKAIGEWSVSLGEVGRHTVFDDAEEEADKTNALTHVKTCRGSRAIYVDGQQTWLVYRVSAQPAEIDEIDWRQYNDVEQWNTDIPPSMGDHHVINIASQEVEDSYPIQYLGGVTDPSNADTGTAMEEAFSSLHYTSRSLFPSMHRNIMNVDSGSVKTPYNWGCNNLSFGHQYYVQSSYYPGKSKWSVARIEYDTMDVFCSKAVYVGLDETTEYVGDPEGEFRGNYWIVLPSVRAYIDSDAAAPDEPWVCAIHKDSEADELIVTGRWQSKVYELAGTNPATNYADGTLHADEVENVILDTGDYPGIDWTNIQIRCYNRVYNPLVGHSQDLLIFTTHEDETFQSEAAVIADFEDGDLNEGLSGVGLEFETYGFQETDAWVSINGVFDPPPDMADSAYNGDYFARAQAQTYDIANQITMNLTFNKVFSGYITFRYRHDNRGYTEYPNVVSNDPIPTNRLEIRLDGVFARSDTLIGDSEYPQLKIDDQTTVLGPGGGGVSFGDPLVSNIDNQRYPQNFFGEETDLKGWHKVEIYVPAGTHTLSITQVKETVSEVGGVFLYSDIDYVELGDLMIGQDPTSKTPWIFNGTQVQRAEWWSWPLRDDEVDRNLSLRYSVVPDYITFDKKGRILYGNPHYVVRLIPDEENEGLYKLDETHGSSRGTGHADAEGAGYIRMTATPVFTKEIIGEPAPGCDDPDPEYEVVDLEIDPPWGSMQILAFGEDGDYQLRGMNGSLRDATEFPFPEENFSYVHPSTGETIPELFRDRMTVSKQWCWSMRPSCWTITDNGKHLRPHVEVVWRPTRFTTAYPSGPETPDVWPSPPWQSDFASANSGNDLRQIAVRPRDLLNIASSSTKARWSMTNYIVAATYTDGLTQEPQAVWSRQSGADPTEADEWDPDSESFGEGPWPSARWQLIQAHYVPAGVAQILYSGPNHVSPGDEETCSEDPEDPQYTAIFRAYLEDGGRVIPQVDFDVVDIQCVCCE